MPPTPLPLPPQELPAEDRSAPAAPAGTVNLILAALRRSAKSAGSMPPPAAPPPAEEVVIAGYRLVRHLGRGGMANVYEAVHLLLRRRVALKILILDEERRELAPRFLREARTMMQVRHPHITTIHDAGTVDGTHYLALELITGGDLGARIERDGPLAIDQAIRLMIGCCDGLSAIHAAGLIHRDLKPGNIFLTADGSPKIGDFGLARRSSGADRMTVTGVAWGTPSYMAPEQIVGAADVDSRADLYALGATFYTMITGCEPYPGSTAYMTTFKAMTEPFPDPRLVDPRIPSAVAAIIRMATAHQREQRYDCARSMREDLERAERQERLLHVSVGPAPVAVAADATVQAERPPPWVPRAPPVVGRSLVGPRRGLLIAAVAATVIAWWWLQGVAPSSAAPFPAWASGGGHDAAGRWVELTVGAATTRLRHRDPGSFLMGSPPGEAGRSPGERQHVVTLSTGFWMQETECDQAFHVAVMGTNPSRHRGMDLPVEQITWDEAREFCAVLSRRGVSARLPSEAEWEYACRAGSSGAFASAGQTPGWVARGALREVWERGGGERAAQRFCAEHDRDLTLCAHPVGRLPPNAAGLFDLSGNVLEWCADRWDGQAPLAVEAQTDPYSPSGDQAVARGGSWFLPVAAARSAARLALPVDSRRDDLGFRFVVPDSGPVLP